MKGCAPLDKILTSSAARCVHGRVGSRAKDRAQAVGDLRQIGRRGPAADETVTEVATIGWVSKLG